jgi:hypothetical protein
MLLHAEADLTWFCSGQSKQWVQLQRASRQGSVFVYSTCPLEVKEEALDVWFRIAGN